MKKIKLLTAVSTVAAIGTIAPIAMTVTSCNRGGNTPTPTPTPKVTRAKFVAKFKELCETFKSTAESKTYELNTITGTIDGKTPEEWISRTFTKKGTGSDIYYELAVKLSSEETTSIVASVNATDFKATTIESYLDYLEQLNSIKYSVSSNEIGFTAQNGQFVRKYTWNSLGLLTQYDLYDGSSIEKHITMTYGEKLVVTGNHEMDVANPTTNTLTANQNATWVNKSTDLITLSTTSGTSTDVTLTTAGKQSGGIATVTCQVTAADGSNQSKDFKIVLDTTSQIQYDTSTDPVTIKPAAGVTSGNFIIPGIYYDDQGNEKNTKVADYFGCNSEGTRIVDVQNLVIQEGVKSIGHHAFTQSTFTSVTIPASVKTIGAHAFSASGLSTGGNLTSITFASDSQLTELSQNSFTNQTKLTSISLPDSLETIDRGVFNNCTALTQVDMPSCKSMFMAAFGSCTNLTEITIPSNCTTCGESSMMIAFSLCTSLRTATIDSSNIANNSFNPFDVPEDPSYSAPVTTVYVKNTITVSSGFLKTGWTIDTTGVQKEGYVKYVKN